MEDLGVQERVTLDKRIVFSEEKDFERRRLLKVEDGVKVEPSRMNYESIGETRGRRFFERV